MTATRKGKPSLAVLLNLASGHLSISFCHLLTWLPWSIEDEMGKKARIRLLSSLFRPRIVPVIRGNGSYYKNTRAQHFQLNWFLRIAANLSGYPRLSGNNSRYRQSGKHGAVGLKLYSGSRANHAIGRSFALSGWIRHRDVGHNWLSGSAGNYQAKQTIGEWHTQ